MPNLEDESGALGDGVGVDQTQERKNMDDGEEHDVDENAKMDVDEDNKQTATVQDGDQSKPIGD